MKNCRQNNCLHIRVMPNAAEVSNLVSVLVPILDPWVLTPCCISSLKWSHWSGLNRRPTVYETVALPLSYIGTLVRQRELLPYLMANTLSFHQLRRKPKRLPSLPLRFQQHALPG